VLLRGALAGSERRWSRQAQSDDARQTPLNIPRFVMAALI
jgi:hypothetical protein